MLNNIVYKIQKDWDDALGCISEGGAQDEGTVGQRQPTYANSNVLSMNKECQLQPGAMRGTIEGPQLRLG